MNVFMWIAAGALLGWAGFAMLGINKARGPVVSLIIGAVGGFFGGKVLAPMFTAAAIPGDFSVSALLFAVAMATLFLTVANFVHNRWDV